MEISEAGRAPKNDPALFVLAMCAGLGDDATRRTALEALPRVARTGTHLFHFAEYVEGFRGWGKGLRHAVANWYEARAPRDLAYQLIKYRQRDGWSHRDLLRLAHPRADGERNKLYKWAVDGWQQEWAVTEEELRSGLGLILAFEQAQRAENEGFLCDLIRRDRLPQEAVPDQWKHNPAVWEALLEHMPMTAMLRNLGNMAACGLLVPGAFKPIAKVCDAVANQDALRKARVHPVQVLVAMLVYQQGCGMRGHNSWPVVPQVVDALDKAFYLAFGNVEPTGKRIVLALDISSSMTGGACAGILGLTPRIGSAAMALVTANVEPNYVVVGFSERLRPLDISPRQRLDDVCRYIDGLPFGGTDCALPMLWALENKVEADAFIIYTDSETWAGDVHPAQALQQYRHKTGIPAKLVVVGMVSNGFTIADPNDAGMLDVVGFDAATPQVISDFIAEARPEKAVAVGEEE